MTEHDAEPGDRGRYGPMTSFAEVEIASGAAQQVQRLVSILRDVESGRLQLKHQLVHEQKTRVLEQRRTEEAESAAQDARNRLQTHQDIIAGYHRTLAKLYEAWTEDAARADRRRDDPETPIGDRAVAAMESDTLAKVVKQLQTHLYKPVDVDDFPF